MWQSCIEIQHYAPNGMEAGKAAGIHVVPDRRTKPEKCHHADRIVCIVTKRPGPIAEWGLPPLPK